VKGSDQANDAPASKIEDAKSKEGRIEATDETGRGAFIKKAEAKGDVVARTSSGRGADPKA
jgi:hypothetical protein